MSTKERTPERKAAIRESRHKAVTARMARTLRITDKVLSPFCEKVIIHPEGIGSVIAPGWTDGVTINLAPDMLPKLVNPSGQLDEVAIMVWLGVNAHELGHTLYTPRKDSALDIKVTQMQNGPHPGIWTMWNMVEDQRQERLLIGRFRPWRAYLVAALTNLILDPHHSGMDHRSPKTLWPLIAGRTWVAAPVRLDARRQWHKGQASAKAIATEIGNYQRLADPGYDDADEAIDILIRLWALLYDTPEKWGNCTMGEGDEPLQGEVSERKVPSAGSRTDNENLKDQEKAERKAKAQAKADADKEAAENCQSNDSSDSDPDGEGEDEADGADGQGGDGDEPDAEPGEASGTGGSEPSNKGTPNPRPQPMTVDRVKDALKDQAKRIAASDKGTATDLAEVKESLSPSPQSGLGTDSLHVKEVETWTTPDPMSARVAAEIGDHYRRLVEQTMSHWVRRTDSGKLNVGRYMARQPFEPYDGLFDRFEQGQDDEISLDVTILLDCSGSMHEYWPAYTRGNPVEQVVLPKRMAAAAQATWVIRRAVEAAQGQCTVIGWNVGAWQIDGPHSRPSPTAVRVPGSGGGTDPAQAINDTFTRVIASQAVNRVVILVTDGQMTVNNSTLLMKEMADQGIITIGVVLTPYLTYDDIDLTGLTPAEKEEHRAKRQARDLSAIDGMGCTYTLVMAELTDLVPVFHQLVADQMRNNLGRVGVNV